HVHLWDAVAGQGHIWTYMRYGPFTDAAVFSDWLISREEARDPFYYAIIDRCGHALRLAALMRIEPDMRVVEVGNILLSPRRSIFWRGTFSRRSGIVATSGNAMLSMPPRGAPHCALAFRLKAFSATT